MSDVIPLGEVAPPVPEGLIIEGIGTTRHWNAVEVPLAHGLKRLDGSTTRRVHGLKPTFCVVELPLPLLWRHNWNQKIGEMFAVSASDLSVYFKACIVPPGTPNYDSALLERVWKDIQSRDVQGVSFSTRLLDEDGAWRGIELSVCPTGGNPYAVITRATFPNGEIIERCAPSFDVVSAQRAWLSFEDSYKRNAAVSATSVETRTAVTNREDLRELVKREVAEFHKTMHRGVWREGEIYERGQMATFNGGTWSCQRDGATGKPGESADWLLIVKAGRDGRDRR